MRSFYNINRYLDELASDVYSQPEDNGHTAMTQEVFERWVLLVPAREVLDIGCGANAVAEPFFTGAGWKYTGVSLGDDAVLARLAGKNVHDMDMSFLEFDDESFDLVWCRHVLEHSPMPLLTLMEFHRVSKAWLCLVMPNPKHFTFVGRNHYYVAERHQIVWLLRRAGWKIVEMEFTSQEFRFMCVKQPRISYEGYVPVPLESLLYAFERDQLVDNQVINAEQAMKEMGAEGRQ